MVVRNYHHPIAAALVVRSFHPLGSEFELTPPTISTALSHSVFFARCSFSTSSSCHSKLSLSSQSLSASSRTTATFTCRRHSLLLCLLLFPSPWFSAGLRTLHWSPPMSASATSTLSLGLHRPVPHTNSAFLGRYPTTAHCAPKARSSMMASGSTVLRASSARVRLDASRSPLSWIHRLPCASRSRCSARRGSAEVSRRLRC